MSDKPESGLDPAWEELLGEVEDRRARALEGGGPRRIEREHAAGRLTARERIAALVDPGSFDEYGMLSTMPSEGDGEDLPTSFVCGIARIDGRPVAVGADDFTVQGGAVGVHLFKLKGAWGGFIEEFALGHRIPLVLLLNGVGGGITMQEAKGFPVLVSADSAYPVFELLDCVPVVAAVLGPTAGAAAARAAASHFSIISREHGCLFAGGPPLVKQALGVQVDKLELGGAEVHTTVSGVIDNAADSEIEIFEQIRSFLSFMPSSVWALPPRLPSDDPADRSCDDLLSVVSPNSRRPYDARALIAAVVDDGYFFEKTPGYGRSLITALARIDGHPVGVLASNPQHLAGAMDVPAAEKQTRFAELCNAFNLPMVYFVDIPGLMIGPDAERSGVLRAGARAVHALRRATVPVYTIQVRRSFGLGGQGTGNPNHLSMRLAWPTGVWGDMPLAGGIEAQFRGEIEAADDPAAKRAEIFERFELQASPWRTIERFGVEEMLDPRETRRRLANLLELSTAALDTGVKPGPGVRP